MNRPVAAAKHRALQARETCSEDPGAAWRESTGKLEILFVDGETGTPDVYRVDFLLGFPNLKGVTISALLRNAAGKNVTTAEGRRRLYRVLRAGFLQFLKEGERQDLRVEELDREIGASFQHWLLRRKPDGRHLSQSVRWTYYSAFVQLVGLIALDPVHAPLSPDRLPFNPWKENKTKEKSEGLSEGDLRQIVQFCAGEVRSTSETVGRNLALAYGHFDGEVSPRDADLQKLLRELLLLDPKDQTYTTLSRKRPDLAASMDRLGREEIIRALHPSLQDLIPFIVLFAVAFRFNESVLLMSNQSDFNAAPWLGSERVVAHPVKPRSGRRQTSSVVSTEDAINPRQMLRLLALWTQSIRRTSPTDRLIVFWTRRGAYKGLVVLGRDHKNWAQTFGTAVRAFVRRAGLPKFTLTEIRQFLLDVAHEVTGGDLLAVRAAGGQRSLDVVGEHYVTRAGRRREDEALAEGMIKRQLHMATGGTYDARRHPETDTKAVTPGWRCERGGGAPPFHRERGDGLCVSYGRCPVCRHGRIDSACPTAFALNVRLLEAIDRSVDAIGPEAWLGRLSPIRIRLVEEILPAFDPKARRIGEQLSMPPLPNLE